MTAHPLPWYTAIELNARPLCAEHKNRTACSTLSRHKEMDNMKRIQLLLVLALLAVSLIACMPVRAAPAAQGATVAQAEGEPLAPARDAPRTITVVGAGKVGLVPDVARINVGAEVRADTVSEAKDEVDRQIAAIRTALDELGVEARDIQTSHYSINYDREPIPVVRDDPAGSDHGGYRVSNMLRVTVRDVERAGEVLDAVVEAGANQVYGATFTVSDEGRWQGPARCPVPLSAAACPGSLEGKGLRARVEILCCAQDRQLTWWLIQVPLAWLLSRALALGATGA
jgi:uncharacterized protein YggE